MEGDGFSRRAFLGGLLGLAGTEACAPLARRPYAPALDAEQNTAEIARGIIGGRTGALFYVDRLRGRPGADRITNFSHWDDLSAYLELDPLRDVHRAFACAPTSESNDSLLVLEHELDDARMRTLVARGGHPSARRNGLGSVHVELDKTDFVIALPHPGMLVLAPPWTAPHLGELVAAGGLPNPRGSEVARFFAFRPKDSLGSTPEWPDSIGAAQAEITFDEQGGANVLFQASSTSAPQAAKDAAVMEKTLDDLLHITLGPIRIPIFDPIHFRADGDLVRMEAHLLASDVDWILGFRPP